MREIDHLVYCVPELKAAMEFFQFVHGIHFTYGGQHLTQGTHNALLNIGKGAYLELLAIDPTNHNIDPPRWMGIDLITEPKLTRWAIKTNDLSSDVAILKEANPNMGEQFNGSRKKTDGSILEWGMALPLATPKVEILPFMIDWKTSIHPTESLSKIYPLTALKATYPEPSVIEKPLKKLGIDLEVLEAKEVSLQATIQGPKGEVVLK